MARVGILKTKILFSTSSQNVQPVGRCMSKLREANLKGASSIGEEEGGKREESSSSCWVPHPRTGIYFPQGHEHVMQDVPNQAASFKQTCWFRSIDGVDKPHPDISADFYLVDTD